nr:hypothetical protein [Tanacetum cinerariifolium]
AIQDMSNDEEDGRMGEIDMNVFCDACKKFGFIMSAAESDLGSEFQNVIFYANETKLILERTIQNHYIDFSHIP